MADNFENVIEVAPKGVEVEEGCQNGVITFADEVVATIASFAACEIAGVSNMSGKVSDGFAELLGRKSNTKGVKVEVNDQTASIDCFIYVTYGFKVPQVALEVQHNIKSAVETMTGLDVAAVNVTVMGIEYKKQQKKEETAV